MSSEGGKIGVVEKVGEDGKEVKEWSGVGRSRTEIVVGWDVGTIGETAWMC